MKVFVRSNELGGDEPPTVMAWYADETEVPSNAHQGMTMLTVPNTAIMSEPRADGSPLSQQRLTGDWREQAKNFKPNAALATVREVVQYMLDHGSDTKQWPPNAKQRLEAIKRTWPQP